MTDPALAHVSLALADGRSCPIWIGAGALDLLPELWQPAWRRAAIIGDARVLGLWGEAVAARVRPLCEAVARYEFAPGEASKTRETKASLEDALLEDGLGRDGCVIGLGGGVSLDLAGFVAATYLRGIAYLALATSLLAQVDAAVGGKTGVNTPRGKNLIGAFHQPSAVLCDTTTLATLPAEEWPNGLAELVKHAVVADRELFGWAEEHRAELVRPGAIAAHPLRRCVEIKAAVVAADEREAGRRAILNFGHSVGHALESAAAVAGHGRAVALGMRVEARVARELVGFRATEVARLDSLLGALGLGAPAPISFATLEPFLGVDKKRRAGELRLALPRALGEVESAGGSYTVAAPRELLARAWLELGGAA